MCRFKSCIILKDRVYVPDHDSHEIMLEELNIKDTFENGASIFVRAEIYPEDGDIFSDVTGWKMRVDQDILPEWYVPEIDESRAKGAVAEWMKNHTISEGEQEVRDGVLIAYGSATVAACGRATVTACGSATVTACGSATVAAGDNATVTACENATVTACENAEVIAYERATVAAYDSAKVKAFGSVEVEARDSATVEAIDRVKVTAYGRATIEASDSATVEARDNATVTAHSRATVKATGSAEVTAYESADVTAIGRATVTAFDRATVIIPNYSSNNMDNIRVHDNAIAIDHNTNTIKANKKWRMKE